MASASIEFQSLFQHFQNFYHNSPIITLWRIFLYSFEGQHFTTSIFWDLIFPLFQFPSKKLQLHKDLIYCPSATKKSSQLHLLLYQSPLSAVQLTNQGKIFFLPGSAAELGKSERHSSTRLAAEYTHNSEHRMSDKTHEVFFLRVVVCLEQTVLWNHPHKLSFQTISVY